MISETDRIRAQTMLDEGKSRTEIEALIPGVNLDEMVQSTGHDEDVLRLGRRATPVYLRGRLMQIANEPATSETTRIDIMFKLLTSRG